jgi:hypothetical protein
MHEKPKCSRRNGHFTIFFLMQKSIDEPHSIAILELSLTTDSLPFSTRGRLASTGAIGARAACRGAKRPRKYRLDLLGANDNALVLAALFR